jgi:hypothetical protein
MAQERTIVRPDDTGEALVNPGMGWVLHFYDNNVENYGSRLAPADTVDDFPGLGCVYLRLAWSFIEPEEGVFNWSVIDTPAQRWIRKGLEVSFRISCSEGSVRFATPEWVKRAGAKGHFFRRGEIADESDPRAAWEPDFDDPVFLEKLDSFLGAFAARYDRRPEVSCIDIGSMGIWGEGHTNASTRIAYGGETTRRHIDLHLRHFANTWILYNDDLPSGPPVNGSQGSEPDGPNESVLYAAEKGLGLRDDSILVQGEGKEYFSAWMAPHFWDSAPVCLECEHYGPSAKRGCWRDGSMYLQAVEDYRASYATIHWWPREFYEANRELVDRINMRLGYRLQLVEASWPAEIPVGGPFEFRAEWRNAGAAPCLPGGLPTVTLRDADGGIAGVWAGDSLDVRDLPVGAPGEAESRRQSVTSGTPLFLKPGRYDVLVSVGTTTGTPRIALPLPAGDGERRYKLGEVTIAE